MAWLSIWVRQVGLFVFLAALVQLILPPSSERQAARLVIGLVIILKMIEPLGGWVAQSRIGLPKDLETVWSRPDLYIEQGQLMALETMSTVKLSEQQKVLDQLGAMLTLVQGVDEAQVSFSTDPKDDGPWHVRVRLVGTNSTDAAAEGSQRSEVEDTVRHFLLRFLPQMSRIDIDWHHIAGR